MDEYWLLTLGVNSEVLSEVWCGMLWSGGLFGSSF